jgi:hypothetical protein
MKRLWLRYGTIRLSNKDKHKLLDLFLERKRILQGLPT